jgi:threonine synthase
MARIASLRCRECARTYEPLALHACDFCFGPLEVVYDYEEIAAVISRERIAAGPPSIWRYADLLPASPQGAVDLGAGFTPLVRADRLAAVLGLGELYLKDDTRNPTGSFKDRVVSVALTRARELGFKVAACASTGNLANSVAAHAARAGMESFVFVPADLERVKVSMTAVFGGRLIAVDGNYDDVNRLCAELAWSHPDWAFVNVNVRPYYAEGSKTLAFEVAEQLGWRAPDHVVVPIASGAQLVKIAKGFRELGTVGLLGEPVSVRVSGAQAEGCSPVASAFAAGSDQIRPVRPSTIAKSLSIGNPADGVYALDTVRSSGGAIAAVSDEEILEAIALLARTEGIFAETAGGVTIATLAKLAASGVVRADERVVAYVTGNGLKTVEALGERVGPTTTIAPRLEDFAAFEAALDEAVSSGAPSRGSAASPDAAGRATARPATARPATARPATARRATSPRQGAAS